MTKRVKSSLRASFIDGTFASAQQGMTTEYITPYALALSATTPQIGLLSALPNLASSLVQLYSAELAEKFKSRKKVFTRFVFAQAAMFLPLVLIPWILPPAFRVLALIVCITVINSASAVATPAWASLMAEYIPYRKRGRYFGWRAKVMGGVAVSFSFASGFILYSFGKISLAGFAVIFSVACALRFFSWYWLTRMYEPPLKIKSEDYFSLYDFLRRARESNFAKFVLFVALFNFSVSIASPYFSVFMLRDLGFSYLMYTFLTATVTVATISTINRWGAFADTTGNLRILRFCSFFIATLPAWWVLNRHPAFLFFAQVLSGFAWAGFNLSASNFIFDAVTPGKRTRCIAYFNVFSGLANFFGALTGGFLVRFLPPVFGFKLLGLFLIASAMRFCVAAFLFSRLREVRPVRSMSSKDLFYSVIGLNPALGAFQDAPRQEEE